MLPIHNRKLTAVEDGSSKETTVLYRYYSIPAFDICSSPLRSYSVLLLVVRLMGMVPSVAVPMPMPMAGMVVCVPLGMSVVLAFLRGSRSCSKPIPESSALVVYQYPP